MMVRSFYKDGRHFYNVDDLVDALYQAWNNLDVHYIKNLNKSIPLRIVSVIEKKEFCMEY